MKRVKLKDKEFEIYIDENTIAKAIDQMATKINTDFKDKNPIFLSILNGSFMFSSDLFKKITVNCEISFVKLSSYQGTTSTEKVTSLIGLNEDLKGKSVIILEDIVDTGITIENIIEALKKLEPAEIKVATFLFKPKAYKKSTPIDYIGIEIPNDFIVGYGLDYDGIGRNLCDIYKIV